MAKKRMFISFDFHNDEILRTFLAGQAKLPDSPFDFTDASNKERLSGDWRAKTLTKIKGCDLMAVICGEKTHTAAGVSDEINLAREAGTPYFLLKGYADKTCTKPTAAAASDKVYGWTWENLKTLIAGGR